ncbi:MAG: YceI family protein [Acidimicrobiia bacterium]|nr:YceI family protein [Acidimicrobiia bacterium]
MRTRTKVGLGVVVLVAAGIGVGVWYFYSGDEPEAASVENAIGTTATTAAAAAAADDETTPTDAATSPAATTTPAEDVDIAGSWTVVPNDQGFDYDDEQGTFAGFRIAEELAGIGSTTAVGRTRDVTGTITFDATTLTEATFEVDMATITTNDSRRDDQVARALEVDDFPTGTFTLTEPVDLGDAATSGDVVEVTAVGDLSIHGVTEPVEIPLEAQLIGDQIAVAGSLDIDFADYGVAVPDSQIVVSVEDHGIMEIQLVLQSAR